MHSDQRPARLRHIKTAKTTAVIVGVFIITWTPLYTINSYLYFCGSNCYCPLWLLHFAIVLSHANSAVDPLMYGFAMRGFREKFNKRSRRDTNPSLMYSEKTDTLAPSGNSSARLKKSSSSSSILCQRCSAAALAGEDRKRSRTLQRIPEGSRKEEAMQMSECDLCNGEPKEKWRIHRKFSRPPERFLRFPEMCETMLYSCACDRVLRFGPLRGINGNGMFIKSKTFYETLIST